MPSIAVIIVTYNSVVYLDDLIASLKNIDTEGLSVSFIFVDNNSSDETEKQVRSKFPEAHNIQTGENAGFAKGNNIGYEKAKQLGCEYIYLLNHDTIVEPSFLKEAVKTMQSDDSIKSVQSNLRLYPDTHLLNNMGNMTHFLGFGFCDWYKEPISLVQKDMEITYASGAAVLFKTDVLEHIGLFESDYFMYAEDQDISWRLQLLGYKVFLSAKSIVYHKYSFSKSMKQYYWMERNRLITIFLNYKLPTFFLFLPMMIVFDVLVFVHALVHGNWREKVKVYKYFLNSKNWDSLQRRRHQRQAYRKVKDKDILKRFSGVIRAGELSHPILKYLVNPFMAMYFYLCKLIITW